MLKPSNLSAIPVWARLLPHGAGVGCTSGSHLSFGDESGVRPGRAVAVVQRQTLTQLSQQHGHFLHAPPAAYQHHLGRHSVALVAWSQHRQS